MSLLDNTAIRVNGESISLHSIIQRARMRDQIQFVEEAIQATIIRETSCQLDIGVTRDEAQAAANAFREKHQLQKAQDAVKWLEERGMTVADWQRSLEEDVLIAKMKKIQFEPKVQSFFAEHKLEYDVATIGRIAAPNEGLASELLLQIREEGAVFEDVARKYSTDLKTRDTGGYVGKVTRRDLGPSASAAVFGGSIGSVHGPFKIGKDQVIFRVIALHPAELSDEVRENIKERLFREWLQDARAKANVQIPLFESPVAVVEAR